jgi:hypothetical protein
VASQYLGPGQHGLVLILEQSALFHEVAAGPVGRPGVVLPDHHAGVAMYVRGGPGSVRLGAPVQYADVAPDRARPLLARHLDGSAKVVLGSELSRLAPPGTATVAPPGAPTTGVWSEFADIVNQPGGSDCAVTVADYDAALGYLCVLPAND